MKYLIIALISALLLTTGCTPVNDLSSNDNDEEISEYQEASEYEDQALLKSAEALTRQLIEYSIPSWMIRGNESIGDTEIWRFLMCIFAIEDSPYYQTADLSQADDGIVKYSLADLQIIAYEMFGAEDWFFNPDGNYNEENSHFSVHTDQGLHQGNFISDVKSEIIDSEYINVESTYSCYINSNGDPLLCEIGTYLCVYKIETEDGNTFLRLESYGLLNDRYDISLEIVDTSLVDGCYTKFILTADSDKIYFDGMCAATRMDDYRIIISNVTGDDVPDITVIFTAGTGTGMNIEDVHVFDGAAHNHYEVRNAIDIVKERLILSSDDECYRITSGSGELIINKSELESSPEYLAELPFFDMICRYTVKDGFLYSYMPIQVGITEYYTESNIEVKYRFDENMFDAESVGINETSEIFPQY